MKKKERNKELEFLRSSPFWTVGEAFGLLVGFTGSVGVFPNNESKKELKKCQEINSVYLNIFDLIQRAVTGQEIEIVDSALANFGRDLDVDVIIPKDRAQEVFNKIIKSVSFLEWYKKRKGYLISELKSVGLKIEQENFLDEMVGLEIKNKGSKHDESNKHKALVQAKAKQLWAIDETITIADMLKKDEINDLFEGKVYNEQIMRRWINSDCPNRNPGRRPQKN